MRLARNYNSCESPRKYGGSTDTSGCVSRAKRDLNLHCIDVVGAFLASHNAEDCETSFPHLSFVLLPLPLLLLLNFSQPQISRKTQLLALHTLLLLVHIFVSLLHFTNILIDWSENVAYLFPRGELGRDERNLTRNRRRKSTGSQPT